MTRPPAKLKITRRKLLAVGQGLLAVLALTEGFLWTFDPLDYAGWDDRERFASELLATGSGYPQLIPGARGEYRGRVFAINSEGLRNREVPIQRPPSTFRLLVLGGSVPFGWGVSECDCYPRLIEQRLNEERQHEPQAEGGGRTVEVVNAAVPGHGLQPQLRHLCDIGGRYAPDMVLLPVMWGNVPRHGPRWRSGRFLAPGVRRTIRTLRLLEDLVVELAGPFDEDWKPSDLDPRGLQEVCFGLRLFKQECDRIGARLVVLDMLGVDALRDSCAQLGLLRMPFGSSVAWLERHRISPSDAHPNEVGHRQIADAVVPLLRGEILR